MEKFTCVFYETESGTKPVEEFIDALDKSSWDKFDFKKGLLENNGPALRKPHTSPLGDGIFELKFIGKEGQIRVLFFFWYKKVIVFLHGFVKKTQKTPAKELRIAKQRKLKMTK
ncbi:MAG: type II toxin-antitoxin system RelE/ParE family toxin [Candidatus Omnitrophota bacterium]|nr:type II toxin-antitoxin system RelE/ParE family toxin [bacterium]MBU3929848.1 type II toxin-antitoxin system RelE/ParE family toxin [bacterium]MBU4123001.1 type II toxin-antitoxin system RelE/ParE family toxin [bacterium]